MTDTTVSSTAARTAVATHATPALKSTERLLSFDKTADSAIIAAPTIATISRKTGHPESWTNQSRRSTARV